MKRYFEFKDEKTAKFWQINLDDSTLTTCYGKIGTSGQESEKKFEEMVLAEKEFNKLIAEKTKKGYVEVEKLSDEKLKIEIEAYQKWITTQDWFEEKNRDSYVVIRDAPNKADIELLEDKFGKIPRSYLKTLSEFGLSEFTFDCYKTKMLTPEQIIEFYELIQDEMDFADGLREEIEEADGIDFSKYIPVMAGEGEDGCWALLNLDKKNNGQIVYWNTDEPGYLESTFKNLEEFILASFSRAKENNPLRLT